MLVRLVYLTVDRRRLTDQDFDLLVQHGLSFLDLSFRAASDCVVVQRHLRYQPGKIMLLTYKLREFQRRFGMR